jgi:hypothetical protein
VNDDHRPDAEIDPPLDPEEEARIRALLADLATSPDATSMPPEVAARLDETLAGLVADREDSAGGTPDTNVVPLRRRWAKGAAAAAAAVIVAGAGGVAAANFGLLGGGASSDSATAGSASKAESLDEFAESPTSPGATSDQPVNGLTDVPTIRAASLEADVARVLQHIAALADGSAGDQSNRAPNRREAAEKDDTADSRRSACPGPRRTGDAARIPVRYDGTLALLLVRPGQAGTAGERIVEVWACAGDRRLARASVPGAGLASPSPSPQD